MFGIDEFAQYSNENVFYYKGAEFRKSTLTDMFKEPAEKADMSVEEYICRRKDEAFKALDDILFHQWHDNKNVVESIRKSAMRGFEDDELFILQCQNGYGEGCVSKSDCMQHLKEYIDKYSPQYAVIANRKGVICEGMLDETLQRKLARLFDDYTNVSERFFVRCIPDEEKQKKKERNWER